MLLLWSNLYKLNNQIALRGEPEKLLTPNSSQVSIFLELGLDYKKILIEVDVKKLQNYKHNKHNSQLHYALVSCNKAEQLSIAFFWIYCYQHTCDIAYIASIHLRLKAYRGLPKKIFFGYLRDC